MMKLDYYNITIDGQISSTSKLLSTFVDAGVDFHAFKAIPLKPNQTQFTLFAKDPSQMTEERKGRD